MTKYYSYGVSLSKGQLEKLSRAYNNNSAITIRLARNELSGPHELMLTKTQINKLRKAMSQGTGSDIKISKTQIRKAVRQGGSLWGSLINLGSKLLPMAMPLAKKAIAPLATGALSGLASLGVDKIFGKGQQPIQFNLNSRNNTVRFINKRLSNIDLLQWVKQLGIKYFRGIYSRDNLPDKIHKLETGIINLDDSMGGGSHWICYRNVDKQYCEYFDPFGLIMPNEIKNYLKTSGKKMVYSSDEIQERDSVLCGYWCLYYLLERQKGKSLLDVIHNPKFSFTNQMINHQFLINYFM